MRIIISKREYVSLGGDANELLGKSWGETGWTYYRYFDGQ